VTSSPRFDGLAPHPWVGRGPGGGWTAARRPAAVLMLERDPCGAPRWLELGTVAPMKDAHIAGESYEHVTCEPRHSTTPETPEQYRIAWEAAGRPGIDGLGWRDSLMQHCPPDWTPERALAERLPTFSGDGEVPEPDLLARLVLAQHATDTLNAWHYSAARVALYRVGAEDTPDAREVLAVAVRRECVALAEGLGQAPSVEDCNRAVLELLERLELKAERLGSLHRLTAKNPGGMWGELLDAQQTSLPGIYLAPRMRVAFARLLAEALWHAERRRASESRPALVRTAYVGEVLALATGVNLVLPGLDDNTIRDQRNVPIARVTGMDANAIRVAASALRTLPGNRVLNGLVRLGWEQVESGKPDPRRVDFVGGWEAFAGEMGLTSRHHHEQARHVLKLGQHVEWQARHGHAGGGWWTWMYKRGSRAGPGLVRAVLGDMLLPGYAVHMAEMGGRSHLAREARRLVPELRHEPPLSQLSGGEEGPGMLLQRLFVVALVDGAEHLATRGLVEIPEDEWRRMTADAGVSASRLGRVLDSWAAGDDRAPPLLERDGWGFTLANPHDLELLFLKEQGQQRINGRVRAKKTKRSKGREKS